MLNVAINQTQARVVSKAILLFAVALFVGTNARAEMGAPYSAAYPGPYNYRPGAPVRPGQPRGPQGMYGRGQVQGYRSGGYSYSYGVRRNVQFGTGVRGGGMTVQQGGSHGINTFSPIAAGVSGGMAVRGGGRPCARVAVRRRPCARRFTISIRIRSSGRRCRRF